MDNGQYVGITCWTSITLILWALISELVQPSFVVWFAFSFFCFIGLAAWATNRKQ